MNLDTISARVAAIVTTAALALGLSLVASSASADTMPTNPSDPTTPVTIAADALPTAQIDGVAWAQAVVGNTVYVVGSFSTARPAGAAPGVNTVVRNNILAYDITTGALISSFAPSLNAQALAITASPDGSRIYIAGDFTAIDGVGYYRIAAFNTATGAVIPSFKPILGSQGRSLQATNSTVYVGGTFQSVSGLPRLFLASINASDGAVNNWVSNADAEVSALALTKDGNKLVAGGRFTNLAGNAVRGLAAVSPSTGASVPWAASATVRNAGTQSAITSLIATNDRVYGTGYVYAIDRTQASGNLEGTFSADPATGNVIWIEDCHGDTYSAFPQGDAIYVASHSHYCGNIGGYPQTDPWVMHYGNSFSKAATKTITADPLGYFNWAGNPAPSLLDWFPTLSPGTYTGQGQAGWSVSGNNTYVTYAGEFTHANGVGQQGLVRFAVPAVAPNKTGPVTNVPLVPTVGSFSAGTARISWLATYDYDNANLTYKLVRDGQVNTPIYTTTAKSNFYTRQAMGFVDSGLAPGSTHTYRVYVTDPYGNSTSRLAPTVTVATGDTHGTYEKSVLASNPSGYWPLDESTGSMGLDHKALTDLYTNTGVTRGAAGIVAGQTASTFNGTSTGLAIIPGARPAPNTFSAEAWIKTTTTRGGKIIGFGNEYTGSSTSYDRHVYMDNSGRIWFGVNNGANRTVNSSASFNNGQWHHIVAQLSPAGMRLYVDGVVVGSRTDATTGRAIAAGYWRVGGDALSGWSSAPSSRYFAGDIAQVALYDTAITRSQVISHYTASGRTASGPTAPADVYGAAVFALDPTLYWRLNETSGTTANDAGPFGYPGAYNGSVSRGLAGAIAGTSDKSVQFGSGSSVGSNSTFAAPSTYSVETWFSTSTNNGGKLIGFGNKKTGNSATYDRHVYMQPNGKLVFGTNTGTASTITTPLSYNNGQWHHVVATQSADGMKLYVDGALVGTNASTTALNFTGYWRIGADTIAGQSNNSFSGKLDEVAVYSTALSASTVADHYQVGLGTGTPNVAPTAQFSYVKTFLDATFDGTASSDSDGTIASATWDFGDSTTATGLTASHTYAATGTYVVKLTVTDDDGATAFITQPLSVVANQLPVALFSSTSTNLTANFNGTASNDPDGSIASSVWDFGDSTSGTGLTTSHTYAAEGTYTAKLTVTDNGGASSFVTHDVTVTAPPAVNQPPVASFSVSKNQLVVNVNGTGSTDSDGTITNWSWNWGDGTTGTGSTATHTYAAGGTYTITLTVTDDDLATNVASAPVTVAGPPPTTIALASDDFERSVATGWGTATVGGVWTNSGTATPLKVAAGVGVATLPAGSTRTISLNSTPLLDSDSQVSFTLDAVPTGGGAYTSIMARQSATGSYYAQAWVKSTGAIVLVLKQGTTVLSTTTVAGLTYTPGLSLSLRAVVSGVNPTTIKARIWQTGQPEPTTWLSTVTDSTAALQVAGAPALQSAITSSSTAPVVTSFDNFLVQAP